MKSLLRSSLAILVVSVVALPVSIAHGAGAEQPMVVSVGGVSVLDPALARAIGPMAGGQPGSHLVIVVKSPNVAIIAIDGQASRLTSFKDDKGKDLMVAPPEPPAAPDSNQGGMMMMGTPMAGFMFPAIAANGKTAMISVDAPALPSPAATRLVLKGELKVTIGGAKDVVELKDTPLKPGPLAVKGHTIEIVNGGGMGSMMMMNGQGDASGTPMGTGAPAQGSQVTIQATGPTADSVASVEFLDAGGKVIKATPGGSMSMPGMRTMSFQLAQKVEKATIRIGLWKDLKVVDVPLDVSAGIGLGESK